MANASSRVTSEGKDTRARAGRASQGDRERPQVFVSVVFVSGAEAARPHRAGPRQDESEELTWGPEPALPPRRALALTGRRRFELCPPTRATPLAEPFPSSNLRAAGVESRRTASREEHFDWRAVKERRDFYGKAVLFVGADWLRRCGGKGLLLAPRRPLGWVAVRGLSGPPSPRKGCWPVFMGLV